MKRVSIRPASLDAPISDDDSTKFGEIVGDEDAQTPFELFRDKSMRDELSELLQVLDDRERKIIFERFGLDGGKPKTLEEVGKKFGVTRERIRQLQNIALAKLRRALAKREKPIVRRDPIQFLKPVSPDPTRTRLRVAKAEGIVPGSTVLMKPNSSGKTLFARCDLEGCRNSLSR